MKTSAELARDIGIETNNLLSYVRLNKIELKKENVGGHYTYVFPDTVCESIKAHFEKLQADKIKAKPAVKKIAFDLEQAKKEHPLVTDERWLRLNNWPDIVPKCFEDMED